MKNVKENVDKWSQLPTLLLWMIRDKLFSFTDVFHLSFVCKEWKLASESYLFNSQRRHLAPWIMLRSRATGVPTKCEFVSIMTNERLILDLPEFRRAELVYSKQGWLLVRVRYQPLERPVTLLHLYTNTKIIMSDPGKCVRGSIGCFSSSADGNPKYLIFNASWGTCMTFCVALVGDNNWIKYSYETGRRTDRITSLVALENKVYCIEESGSLCIFDMSNLVWTEIRVTEIVKNPVGPYGSGGDYCYSRIMETEKCGIVRIQEVGDKSTHEFSKLNEKTNCWEVLNNSDMEGMSWFISIQLNNQFIGKEMGAMKKVYRACGDPAWRNNLHWMLDIYDLSDGSKKYYRPNKDIMQWVDLGTVFKIPPSCVGYEPPSGIANDVF